MKIPLYSILILGVAASIIAAPNEPDSAASPTETQAEEGFRFLGGNAERGKDTFANLQCIQCHQVANAELPEPDGKRRLDLMIGKEPRFVKSYEDIITAITNPQHVVTEQYRSILTTPEQQGDIQSFMPDLKEGMTVQQLIDLVTFLDAHYSESNPEYK